MEREEQRVPCGGAVAGPAQPDILSGLERDRTDSSTVGMPEAGWPSDPAVCTDTSLEDTRISSSSLL